MMKIEIIIILAMIKIGYKLSWDGGEAQDAAKPWDECF